MTGITLRVSDRSKIDGDEGSEPVLSGGSCEGERDEILKKILRTQILDINWEQRVDPI